MMTDWLDGVVPAGYMQAVLWTAAALVALVVVLIVVRMVRGLRSGTYVAGGRNRKTRLAVMDAAAIDAKRRLVLIRRDDVEHLILIGGPTDVVVEQDIRLTERVIRPLAAPEPEPEIEIAQAAAQPPAQRQPAPPPPRQPETFTPPRPVSQLRELASEPRPAAPPRNAPAAPPPAPAEPPMRQLYASTFPARQSSAPAAAPAAPAQPRSGGTVPVRAPEPPRSATGTGHTIIPTGLARAGTTASQATPTAPKPAPASGDLDADLLRELETSLDDSSRSGDAALDEEMTKLLGELSKERR